MEWNSTTPSEWDWENLAMYGSKAIEIHKHVQLCSHESEGNVVDNGTIYSSGGGCFSDSDLGLGSSMKSSVSASVDSSSKEGTETFGGNEGFSEYFSEKEEFSGVDKNGNFPISIRASVGSGEPMIGLKLGRRTYFEDMCAATTTKTTSFCATPTSSSATTKRSREFYQVAQSPRCQVQGCNLDLASAKDYHRRHRICQSHSKSPKVIVAGMERRFCQQCSRFHDLSEFDDKKRSCRRRLSDHNARRRRPQQEAIHFSSTGLSSSLYDQRPGMNFLLNRVPIAVSDRTWENDCNFKVTLARDSLISPAKHGTIDRKLNFPSDTMPNAISTLHLDSHRVSSFHGITPCVLDRGLEATAITSTLDVAPELRHALSLLSSNYWGLNEREPTSLEQLVHGNNAGVAQPVTHSLASSEYMRVEEAPSESQVHSLDLHNISSTRFHEFQLFRTPHESDRFYSNQIN